MTNKLTDLPDYPALQQFSRALWRNGSIRGAALLVGAGFTKNAIFPGVDTPSPPLWSDLVKDLEGQLYPNEKDEAPINPLRIAEEYRTYFGQAALDDFIRTRFPDRAWLPGPLHTELLELPWSDILTTNWDTLLERTAEFSVDYVYDVVRFEADLPHARSPRIVKLHGSIGDIGPLIFAEEDYRTYPAKHAAFVNLARQIFIENELCLLGFSGDDPNFLQWAGWVRDQLGGKARRIYLVGNLNLPPARRKFLESHNIAPIDFAPLMEEVPRAERHAAAARLFFDALKQAKPDPLHKWNLTPSGEYPLSNAGHEAYQRVRKDDIFAADLLNQTALLLKADREKYPGWLICPASLRQNLRHDGDEAWLLRTSVLDLFELPRRAEILYEFLWRHTIGFRPLSETITKTITDTLDASTPEIPLTLRCEFAIALMREARLSNDSDTLDRWGKFIDSETSVNMSYRTEAQYQRCLQSRDQLDLSALSMGLATLDSSDPIWQMRRAALYAEIGQYVQATKLLKEVVAEFDKRHRLDRGSLWIKSRLGWADWLCRGSDAANFSRRHELPSPREFKDLLIDPSDEINRITNAAQEIQSKHREEDAEIVPLFDPGHYRDAPGTIHGQVEGSSFGVFYEFDQLIEVGGVPIHLNHVSICGEAAIGVLKIAYQRNVEWYVRLLRSLHSHYDKPFERYFGRIAIAQLSDEVSLKLISIIGQAISFWFERIKESQSPEYADDLGHARDQLRLLLMALSRFTVRMSEDEAQRVLQRALTLATDPLIRHHWLLQALGDLASYAAKAISKDRQGTLALNVMEFPLSVEKEANGNFWPQIVTSIWESTPDRTSGDTRWQHRVQRLIAAAEKGQPARKEAILRLAYLTLRKSLTDDEASAFGRALWSETDDHQSALPSDTGLLTSTFAQMPCIDGVDAIERVRIRLFDVDLQAILALPKPLGTAALSEKRSILMSLRNAQPMGLTLDLNRAVQLFDQMVSWEPPETGNRDPFGASMIHSFADGMLQDIGDVLTYVVVPAMGSPNRTEERAGALLKFATVTKGWHSLPGLPYFLATVPSMTVDIVTAIRRGLVSSEHRYVSCASTALVRWGKLVRDGVLTVLPRALVEQMIATIETRHEQGLHSLLGAALLLLKDGFLEPHNKEQLMQALSDLLVETQYADIEHDSGRAVSISLVRVECVKLAAALRKEEVDDDGTLQKWIDAAPSDPLPEVRFSIADI
jgi:hypothetical protein